MDFFLFLCKPVIPIIFALNGCWSRIISLSRPNCCDGVFWYLACPESTLLLYATVDKLGENPLHKVVAVPLVQNYPLEPNTREGWRGNDITINHTLLTILYLLPCGAENCKVAQEIFCFSQQKRCTSGPEQHFLKLVPKLVVSAHV